MCQLDGGRATRSMSAGFHLVHVRDKNLPFPGRTSRRLDDDKGNATIVHNYRFLSALIATPSSLFDASFPLNSSIQAFYALSRVAFLASGDLLGARFGSAFAANGRYSCRILM